MKSRFGEIEDFDVYMVINMDATYVVLLGRPWMHKNAAVPSTYHQYVKYPLLGAQGTIIADNDMDDTDVPIIIPVRHPLVGFTRLLTSFE